jgi:hypothetical protein
MASRGGELAGAPSWSFVEMTGQERTHVLERDEGDHAADRRE